MNYYVINLYGTDQIVGSTSKPPVGYVCDADADLYGKAFKVVGSGDAKKAELDVLGESQRLLDVAAKVEEVKQEGIAKRALIEKLKANKSKTMTLPEMRDHLEDVLEFLGL